MNAIRPPPVLPPRDALAAAIAADSARQAQIAATQAAHDAARSAARAAQAVRDEAEAAVAAAPAAAARHLINAAAGRGGTPPVSGRQARELLVDAEADLQAARQAEAALAAELRKMTGYEFTGRRVTEAAAAVLATSPGFSTLIAEAEALQRRLAELAEIMRWAAEVGVIPLRRIDGLTAAQIVADRLQKAPTLWRELVAAEGGAAPWRAALAALERDAAAPTPP